MTECDRSLRKTTLLRFFHMLHKSDTILSNGTLGVEVLNSDNQIGILSDESEDSVEGTQLWSLARSHTSCAAGHRRNKCSVSSMSALHRGQIGSI